MIHVSVQNETVGVEAMFCVETVERTDEKQKHMEKKRPWTPDTTEPILAMESQLPLTSNIEVIWWCSVILLHLSLAWWSLLAWNVHVRSVSHQRVSLPLIIHPV